MNLNIPITIYNPTQEECVRQGWNYVDNSHLMVINNSYYWWHVLDTPFNLTTITLDWVQSTFCQPTSTALYNRTFNFSNPVFHTDDFAKNYPELLI